MSAIGATVWVDSSSILPTTPTSICAGCRWECSHRYLSSLAWIILVIMHHGPMVRRRRKYSFSMTRYVMYKTSRPMMTPLFYDHLQDVNTYQISDQYMFGRDMMVCPVTVKNALSRPVYFPGGDWLDFWTGERISGRQYKSFLTPIEIMPIFLRRGTIIPRQEAMQYVDERPNTNISLLIYPSEHSVYEMYEDDGKTLDYQKGIYAITKTGTERMDTQYHDS